MLQETIKAVKDAENKAETILKEADEKVISLREQANQDAKTLKEEEAKKAREHAAKAKAESEMKIFDSETEKEIAALKQMAAAKENKAIEMVISSLY